MKFAPVAPAGALLALFGQLGTATPITAGPDVGLPTSDVYPPAGSER